MMFLVSNYQRVKLLIIENSKVQIIEVNGGWDLNNSKYTATLWIMDAMIYDHATHVLPFPPVYICFFRCKAVYSVSFMDPYMLSSAMAVEIMVEGVDHAAESSQPNIHGVNERQIGVDPVSLKPSTVATVEDLANPKFISSSLPCSATTSPRTPRALMKNLKKWRHQHPPPLPPFTRQRSAVMSSISSTEEIHLRRSKSCGEGRSCPPSDEFDIVLKKINHVRDQENEDHLVYDVNWEHVPSPRRSDACEQEFKCSALCIFLPNFSNKVKQVKPKKEPKEDQGSVLSRTVSLEKFECGSWASLPATISGEMNESMSIYFDLPVELIRTGGNEMQSPVTAAFVFGRERKGCLKKDGSRRSCGDSARHVRFSDTLPASYPSSPTSFCVSPRLRKAREDFNSYLEEAQRA